MLTNGQILVGNIQNIFEDFQIGLVMKFQGH